jgi:membrane-associated protein
MELLTTLIDLVLHVDKHLAELVAAHGAWVYAVLFLIVFIETGVVVMPFLPGDSLLFVVGTMAGADLLNGPLCAVLLISAAAAGDQLNYRIGRSLGPRVFGWEQTRWFNKAAFDRAHAFYQRHGGPTIILARFVPLVRTFAPFVAGVAAMDAARFTAYNVAGAVLWVLGLLLAGYTLGQFAWVKQHLEWLIWGLLLIPTALVVLAAWRQRGEAPKAG